MESQREALDKFLRVTVEILGLFLWAHIRFQKFLKISKPM
jgi:hypothetical protein